MTEKYDSNGDFGGYTSDFKRDKRKPEDGDDENPEPMNEDENENNPAAQKAGEYVRELLAEKLTLDQNKHRNANRLLDQEIAKVQSLGRAPPREFKYVDIYREKPIKVTVKVLVPVREHPRFNFVGKLLGPKGSSMKRLQEETMCKMAILGRGSMRDRQKEEELRQSLDPKYAHLNDELHVEISALGPPAEAHARIAFALAEVRKYLIPDSNDTIRQEQLRMMEMLADDGEHKESPLPPKRPALARGDHLSETLEMKADRMRGVEPYSPSDPSKESPALPLKRPAISRAPASPYPPPLMRTATRTPMPARSVMPAKTKIMSILDRARIAMEESYGANEEPYEPNEPAYSYSSARSAYPSSRRYEQPSYETEYYTRERGGGDGGYGADPKQQKNTGKSILSLLQNSRRF